MTGPGLAIAADIRRGRRKAAAVVEEAIAAAEKDQLNAFTDPTFDRARREAAAVDASIAAGTDPGPLAGVPFAVKNLFDLEGLVTRAGSKINRDNAPALRDSVLVERLVAAGAVCVGALNMGEYAYDFTGENGHNGASRNPHNRDHMTGGSSGGSGAAVGGRLVPIALGSDTNGSIRVPSSFCGLFGLKPTYGRLPRTGTFPFVDSLDHLGPMTLALDDLAAVYDAMQGWDGGDPACVDVPSSPVTSSLLDDGPIRALRLEGYFRGQGVPDVDAITDQVAHVLGARPLALEGVAQARVSAYLITMTEASALHQERLATRPYDFEPVVRDRLMAGALLPGIHYVKAQRVRRAFRETVMKAFEVADVMIAPATPFPAPKLGQQMGEINGVTVPLRPNIGIYTQPLSFIGVPVLTIPAGRVQGLPVGVQIAAPPFREDLAFRAAAKLVAAGIAVAPEPTK